MGITVPHHVIHFLNKGSKFVVDRKVSHAQDMHLGLTSLHRRLTNAAYFNSRSNSMRERPSSRCRVASDWIPPVRYKAIDEYIALVRNNIYEHYSAREKKHNISWFDRKAVQWLRKHRRQIVIVDADKNLGDALVPREWVSNHLQKLLVEGFDPVTEEEFVRQARTVQDHMEVVLTRAASSGALEEKTKHFIQHRFADRRCGTFRLRIKLHKTPHAARPIANLTHSWVQPASIWIVEQLNPIIKEIQTIVNSSADFIAKHGICKRKLTKLAIICTIDAKNLYPSINQRHLLEVITVRIRKSMLSWSKQCLLITMIDLVQRAQHVRHRGQIWQCIRGIATGSAAGVVLANFYLATFDEFVMEAFGGLFWYARFVDDVCAAIEEAELAGLHAHMNTWHPSIQWEITAAGAKELPFLDLSLSREEDGTIDFQTYRKPQNAYLYLPPGSAHPPHVYTALVQGELQRLARTNRSRQTLQKHTEFFFDRLKERGYTKQVLNEAYKRFRHPRQKQSRTNKYFLKTTWSSTLNTSRIHKAMKRYLPLLQSELKACSVGITHGIQPPLFLERYRDNWTFST